MKSTNNLDNTFGLFSDRVIELCNHSFSDMYRRIFKGYWDNAIFARMRKPYFKSDFSEGYYEIYIPTFEDPEGLNMRYYRIAIQVLPELDNDIMRREELKLRKTKVCDGNGPAGSVDSELLVLIAPHRSAKGIEENQFLRSHRTYPQVKGYLTAAIIQKIPETVVKRLLKIIANFIWRRMRAFVKSWRLGSLIGEYSENVLYYIVSNILEAKNQMSFANALRCLYHTLNWILKKIEHIWAELGRQAQIKVVIGKIEELKPLLHEIRSSPQYMKNNGDPPFLEPLIQMVFQSFMSG